MKYKSRLFLFLLLPTAFGAMAAKPAYTGYYRGSAKVLPPGLYSFTDITDAAGSATRVAKPAFPGANWQKTAFDGTRRFTFFRAVSGAPRDGAGLYDAGTLSSISKNRDTGTAYSFSDWHGIACSDPFFYGLYAGDALTGPGLYRFEDPADPERTAVRLFPSQTFPADTCGGRRALPVCQNGSKRRPRNLSVQSGNRLLYAGQWRRNLRGLGWAGRPYGSAPGTDVGKPGASG